MVMERITEAAKEFEKKTGLPPLSRLVETVDKLPNERRLKLIKAVLDSAERVSKTAPELEKVIVLIQEINSMSTEKLLTLDKVLKRIEKIVTKAPEELVTFLASLKGE